MDSLISAQEVAWYLTRYDKILSGEIDAGQWRSDLDPGRKKKRDGVENITRVMWPSERIPNLSDSPAYERALKVISEDRCVCR